MIRLYLILLFCVFQLCCYAQRPTIEPYVPTRRAMRPDEDLTSYLREVIAEEERQKQAYMYKQQYQQQEVAVCLQEAQAFYEQNRLANKGNFYKNGSYFMRFTAGENSCYDVELTVRNNRVWDMDLTGCKGSSYPIQHGRGQINVTCLRNGVVSKGTLYFYLMHRR